ncbi:MAG: hypothetical protein ABIH42_06220, partial [Planctomycetota bacterium]
MSKKEKMQSRVREILANAPDGMKRIEIKKTLIEEFPGSESYRFTDLIRGANGVEQISRGFYRHIKYKDIEKPPQPTESVKEEKFYKSFADWLVDEDECTKAIPLGGNKFGGKWGTPDVIGKWESRYGDIVKAPTEIVSAEIKTDTAGLITAFGQSCAYKLFSRKSYIVIPKNSPEEDK